MDNVLFVAGAAVFALCIVPLLFFLEDLYKRKKHLRKVISSMAKSVGCQLTTQKIWGDLALGMDERARVLFVVRKHNGQTEMTTYPLDGLQSCSASRQKILNDEGSQRKMRIDHCDLRLLDDKGEQMVITISDTPSKLQFFFDWQLTRQWESKLTKLIS